MSSNDMSIRAKERERQKKTLCGFRLSVDETSGGWYILAEGMKMSSVLNSMD